MNAQDASYSSTLYTVVHISFKFTNIIHSVLIINGVKGLQCKTCIEVHVHPSGPVLWPSGPVHWTQALVLSEYGFESRPSRSRPLCP